MVIRELLFESRCRDRQLEGARKPSWCLHSGRRRIPTPPSAAARLRLRLRLPRLPPPTPLRASYTCPGPCPCCSYPVFVRADVERVAREQLGSTFTVNQARKVRRSWAGAPLAMWAGRQGQGLCRSAMLAGS